MGFQPVVPFSGMAGWAFLKRTQAAQQAAFNATPAIERATAYFAETVGKVTSPAELVGDYRLLKVALGAFGLDADLPNKAFIQKVLSEGTLDPESFANRMVDKRYAALSEAFGFDLGTPNTQLSDFSGRLVDAYRARQFEIAVGDRDNDLRLAMALERDLPEIIARDNTADGKWFAVMGNEPVRRVFETALGLPATTAALDIDRQLEMFRGRARAVFGTGEIGDFADPEMQQRLNQLFLARAQIGAATGGMSPAGIALALLGGT